MEQDIDDVRRSGPQPEELTVKRVRHPGQRVPVAGVTDLKEPAKTRPGEAVVEVVIADHINVVVEVDEVESRHRPIKQRDAQDQGCRHPRRPPLFIGQHVMRYGATDTR